MHLQEPLSLRDGATKIDWLALHAPRMLVFEHSYVTGSGKHTVEHACTVMAVSAAHAGLPGAPSGPGRRGRMRMSPALVVAERV